MTPTSFAGYCVTLAVAAFSLTLRDAAEHVTRGMPFDFVAAFTSHLRERMNQAAQVYACDVDAAEQRGYERGLLEAARRVPVFRPSPPLVIDPATEPQEP